MILKQLNKREIRERIGVFFRSKRWRDTLVFLGFVALASGFWALQYFRQKFEFEVPMKVNYVHIPSEIALSNELPQEITLHIQDKGSAYLNYIVKKRKGSLLVTIDLEEISLNKTSYLIDPTALRSLIEDKLLASTQLKSYFPDKIEINYSLLVQKELPVTINGTISPAAGYLFSDSIRIKPAQVTVYGRKEALDTLREIRTVPVNYSVVSKEWSASADLQAPEGIHLTVDRVNLSVTMEEYTEKIFQLPVICRNLPSNRKIHFFPSTVELGVKVGLSKYSQLSQSDFEIAVDYNDLKERNTANCSLTLTRKPQEADSYRITPNVIEFLIEQKND
ncbi:MAG: CdaR family protein [Candidatus Azobacteroides sp.]|nr:CdaR family protein [Candidatus Azobacteroides sp.]